MLAPGHCPFSLFPTWVDEEEPPERDALAQQHPVLCGDRLRGVGHKGDLHEPEPPSLAGRAAPGEVALLGVGRDGDHAAVEGLELLRPVGEGDELRRAYEGEVLRARRAAF